MNRRTFIATTGVGTGVGGCLTDTGESDEENESTDVVDTDDPGQHASPDTGEEGGDGEPTSSRGDDSGTNESDDRDPASDDPDDAVDDPDDDATAETDDDEPTDGAGREIAFDSCQRATVTGRFGDGDVAFANTGFYDDGLFGNTVLEDGIVFGDDVAAPFSGTVVFEVGDASTVSERGDEIVVPVPDYGSDGTVIESLTTDRTDYDRVTATQANPHAPACLEAIEPNAPADGEATFDVSILGTNAPVDAGALLEVYVELENTGGEEGDGELALVVGHEPERVASRAVTLSPGERTIRGLGYETPRIDADQEVPVRVETDHDGDDVSVHVIGTG